MPSIQSHPIVFTTLAINQTVFFEGVGRKLNEAGFQPIYISFHERSVDYLKERGHEVHNVHELVRDLVKSGEEEAPLELFERFDIANPSQVLSHEKASFEITDSNRLMKKLSRYMQVLEKILANVRSDTKVFQELGGFTSLLSTFYVARKLGLDNIFMEPSFFRGRIFFVRNTISALQVPDSPGKTVSPELRKYLNDTLENRKIVIPDKDAKQYRDVVHKLTSPYNIRRLGEKLADKYILNKQEEFSEIGVFVGRHLRMLKNKFRLAPYYKELPKEPFIYYPLHVPADVALTIRSPEYLDQYSLLDFVARNLPPSYKLAIKEHPALVGAVDASKILELLKKNDQLVLLHPWTNNYDVMKNARVIVTVNSKSGAEAMLLQKSVIVLGNAFYSSTKNVFKIDKLQDFFKVLTVALKKTPEKQAVESYFQSAWDHSYPGEIYKADEHNFKEFTGSIIEYLKTIDPGSERVSTEYAGHITQ